MPEISWRQYKNYSGPVINGPTPVVLPHDDDSHVGRAYLLTTKVETGGTYGAVMSYDGTGMTAGPDQHIAVFPAELASEDFNAEDDQGSLWKLLRCLEIVEGTPSYRAFINELWDELRFENWYVSQDGALRYLTDTELFVGERKLNAKAGDLVFGKHIRDTFTPIGGAVPQDGERWDRACEWATYFHNLTSHPSGHQAQFQFGVEHLVKRTKRRLIKPGLTLENAAYGRELTSIRGPQAGWREDVDLALCVYHSNSVNAPAIANQSINRVLVAHPNRDESFARALIRALGNSTYGRWDDDIKNGRYQRTRASAKASGLWDAALFDGPNALMPADLPG
jgi:hypothetical protein